MKKQKLNRLQQSVYDSVISGPDRITVLTGEGGSGKSFCAARIAEDYHGCVILSATTNVASKILQKSTGLDACTIHSAMGFVLKWIGGNQRLIQKRQPEYADLIIVDECSMLTSEIYEALVSSGASKILLLGDPVQLAPIGSGIILKDVQGRHIELVEQMRHIGVSRTTAGYLTDLRVAIETGNKHPRIPKESPDLIVTSDHSEFTRLYRGEAGTKIILAYRNVTVNAYNRAISNGTKLFEPGDEVRIGAPSSDARNGDILIVTNSIEQPDRVIVELSNNEKVIYWKSKAAMKAITQPLADSKRWTEFYRIKKSSVDLKHLFSSTIHKSQGSGFDTVFIDGSDIENAGSNSLFNHRAPINDLLRLIYVGVSRMKKKVVIFNGDSRDYSKFGRPA